MAEYCSTHYLTYYSWIKPRSKAQQGNIRSKNCSPKNRALTLVLTQITNCMRGIQTNRKTGALAQWLQTNREAQKIKWKQDGGRRSEGWRREIRFLCILLAIHTRTFHLRSHQLSNWESDGDVRAARISTWPELGAPLRPNQNAITFTARTDAHKPTAILILSTHIHTQANV